MSITLQKVGAIFMMVLGVAEVCASLFFAVYVIFAYPASRGDSGGLAAWAFLGAAVTWLGTILWKNAGTKPRPLRQR